MRRLCLAVLAALCLLTVSVLAAEHEALLRSGFKHTAHFLHDSYSLDNHHVLRPLEKGEVNWKWVQSALHSVKSSNISKAGYWDFIPLEVATLTVGGSMSWQGPCFGSVTATLSGNSTGGSIKVQLSKKRDLFCNEFYDFGTREGGYLHTFVDGGTHTVEIAQWREYEWDDVQANGLHVFMFLRDFERTMESVALTVSLFYEPNTQKMFDNNAKFLAEKMQWNLIERPINLVNLTASEIQSGDYLAIFRLDGLDPMIMWGTGGHTGHTAVALEFDDGLYICESTDTPGPPLVYWPPPYGIIRTPYEQWIKQAMSAGYHVSLLRLAPEYASRFNVQAAQNWFFSVQGMPYGWHNFIFTFLDTVTNNLPRPITPDLFEHIMGVAQNAIPITVKGSIYNLLIMGLNQRLNSNCTDLHCIYEIIDPMGKSLSEVCTIPEQDAWRYEGNYSMVCDVFVLSMYKHAGVLGAFNDTIQATEHTPKDTYQMALFDPDWKLPKACLEADPSLPYCQLMGQYVMTLPGYNSIPLYNNMNNYCPSLPPTYMRTYGC